MIRDPFRLDVLIRRVAILQERDAELAEVERLLRLEENASTGTCPHCEAFHSRGALVRQCGWHRWCERRTRRSRR